MKDPPKIPRGLPLTNEYNGRRSVALTQMGSPTRGPGFPKAPQKLTRGPQAPPGRRWRPGRSPQQAPAGGPTCVPRPVAVACAVAGADASAGAGAPPPPTPCAHGPTRPAAARVPPSFACPRCPRATRWPSPPLVRRFASHAAVSLVLWLNALAVAVADWACSRLSCRLRALAVAVADWVCSRLSRRPSPCWRYLIGLHHHQRHCIASGCTDQHFRRCGCSQQQRLGL